MKHKTNILPLLLLVSISLLACIIAFMARGGEVDVMTVLQYFVWNLPICLLVGFIDYKIITWSHRWRIPSGIWSILLDILVSNILLSLLSIVYIYAEASLRGIEVQFYAEASLRGIEVQFMQRIILSVFCNSAIILIVEAFYYNQQYLENKTQLAKTQLAVMEKEKAQYQFEALKNQINPHFLFNSLNVLSSLAYQDAAKANLFAKELSSVYRYLLTTQELMKVPLQDELDFVKSYTYLEQIRFGESLHINLTCDEQALSKST